jgi:hypothetical protein
MKYLIRAAFLVLSLATITTVASAAPLNDTPATIQQSWANG